MPQPWPPHVFGVSVLFAVVSFEGASKWLISGAPIMTYVLLLGASKGSRVLPFIGLWTLIATLNLFYAIAATSWLLYWVFAGFCFPAIGWVCLWQFEIFAGTVRRRLRKLLRTSHFLNDKIAFFDLPALEIDTEVDGLMVIRGVTLHLSSLTIVAHGVEVGIKISDDMELSLQTEEVTIPLFRKVDIGDVFANIKGGDYEMSFGKLAKESKHSPSASLVETDTPVLHAAEASKNEVSGLSASNTNGNRPQPLRNPASTIDVVTRLPLDDAKAAEKYDEIIRSIKRTNSIDQSRIELDWLTDGVEGTKADLSANRKDLRAALCSQLHHKPTIRHPPKHSVKVTSLQNMGPPWFKHFLHRLPLLYRLLLNPISYFHPVSIGSITAAASGKWIQALLNEKVFKHAPSEESETTRIEKRIHSWLSNANFVFELTDITGLAQVPILRNFDIMCILGFKDIMAYRTLPEETNLKQVIRLGGADATVTVPSFLLPHHEHWLPEMPSVEDQHKQEQCIRDIDGKPQALQAKHDLKQMRKDETNVKLSAHVRLPACFDQELLDFIAAIIKATKVVEIEKDMADDNDSDAGSEADTNGAGVDSNGPNADDDGSTHTMKRASTFKAFGKNLSRDLKEFNTNFSANVKTANSSLRDKMKRSTINAVANDRWIAKMVGKITKKLESAQGDVGYSGELPVALGPYRVRAEQGSKLLA